jgi:hypothetical protein
MQTYESNSSVCDPDLAVEEIHDWRSLGVEPDVVVLSEEAYANFIRLLEATDSPLG